MQLFLCKKMSKNEKTYKENKIVKFLFKKKKKEIRIERVYKNVHHILSNPQQFVNGLLSRILLSPNYLLYSYSRTGWAYCSTFSYT